MITPKRSRVPDGINVTDAHFQFLDSLDKRQQKLAAVPSLSDSATTQEIIDALNAVIASHQTR